MRANYQVLLNLSRESVFTLRERTFLLLRILHIGKFYPPFAGGIENFLSDLVSALRKKGVDASTIVHCSAKKSAASAGNSVNDPWVYRVPSYGSILYAPVSPAFPFHLHALIKKINPQIIHAHLPNTSAFWLMLLCNATKIPWIIHWHADVISSQIDRRLGVAYTFYRPLEQRLLSKSAAIISTSHNYLESSIPLTPWRNKCTVIPLGLNPERLPDPDSKGQKQSIALWGDSPKFKVLAIGRLTYYKGHEVLIRAVAETSNVRALIVGQGENEQKLGRLIADLQVKDKVTLCGMLSDSDLHAVLSSADCLCLPSVERTEAFGLVLLEAMRYGKAIIVSNISGSGMSWVVEDWKTGVLFEQEDVQELSRVFENLAADPAKVRNLGLAGQKRFASTFHIDMVAAKINDLYQNILETTYSI